MSITNFSKLLITPQVIQILSTGKVTSKDL